MTTTQFELIHESVYDALRDAVRVLGGSKRVGPMLWPAKTVVEAEGRINDCLNQNKKDKFSLEEILFILRASKDAGYHGAMAFIASECGYRAPEPIEPQDEHDRLQREYIESVKLQQRITQRLERLVTGPNVKAVA